ncbi:MAG: DMP19 family protein [Novosphingobium sp.]
MEAWEKLQPIIDRINPIEINDGMAALTAKEQDVLLVWCYDGAVNNGGHVSFFYNSSGRDAGQTVEALNRIGAQPHAAMLDKAIDLFPDRIVPRDIDERNDALSQMPEAHNGILSALDDEFFGVDYNLLMDKLLAYWESGIEGSIPIQ